MSAVLHRPSPSLPAAGGDRPRRRSLTLVSNVEVGPEIHVLTFELAAGDSMEFRPGQYVTFYLTHGGRSATRSYSIYSSSYRHDRVSLLIKRVPSGFASPFLCGRSPAARPAFTALAPLGKFVLTDPGDRTVVLVATGVGVAPFVPMLERIHDEHPQTPTWLFWGNRFEAELVDRAALSRLAAHWPSFRFVPILSRPPEGGSWSGAVGHVQEHVRARLPDLRSAEVYLCGATGMVNQMQALALELGCPNDRVHVDRWGAHSG